MTFIEGLVPAIFGWPGIFLALALAAAGLAIGRWQLVAAGALASLPFALYLAAHPGGALLAVAIPSMIAGAAVLRYRGKPSVAWAALLPVVAWVAWFAVRVLGR